MSKNVRSFQRPFFASNSIQPGGRSRSESGYFHQSLLQVRRSHRRSFFAGQDGPYGADVRPADLFVFLTSNYGRTRNKTSPVLLKFGKLRIRIQHRRQFIELDLLGGRGTFIAVRKLGILSQKKSDKFQRFARVRGSLGNRQSISTQSACSPCCAAWNAG